MRDDVERRLLSRWVIETRPKTSVAISRPEGQRFLDDDPGSGARMADKNYRTAAAV
jgi:hypothetical protein